MAEFVLTTSSLSSWSTETVVVSWTAEGLSLYTCVQLLAIMPVLQQLGDAHSFF